MGLSDFESYIEMLVALRGRFLRQYLTECIDSLLMKNRPAALAARPRIKKAARRLVLDNRLEPLCDARPGGDVPPCGSGHYGRGGAGGEGECGASRSLDMPLGIG